MISSGSNPRPLWRKVSSPSRNSTEATRLAFPSDTSRAFWRSSQIQRGRTRDRLDSSVRRCLCTPCAVLDARIRVFARSQSCGSGRRPPTVPAFVGTVNGRGRVAPVARVNWSAARFATAAARNGECTMAFKMHGFAL